MLRFFAGARLRSLRLFGLLLLVVEAAMPGTTARAESPLGVSIGAALWAEIGGAGECSDSGLRGPCASGLNDVFPGGTVALDLDLLHWLRLGLSAGLGYTHSAGAFSSAGERTTYRNWFVPLTVHSYWRVELGKHITLWGGPEVGLALFVDQRRRIAPGSMDEIERSTRSAFLAGVAVGLDVRLAGPFRAGIELGEAVLVKGAGENTNGDRIDLRAMTRCALVLRYL